MLLSQLYYERLTLLSSWLQVNPNLSGLVSLNPGRIAVECAKVVSKIEMLEAPAATTKDMMKIEIEIWSLPSPLKVLGCINFFDRKLQNISLTSWNAGASSNLTALLQSDLDIHNDLAFRANENISHPKKLLLLLLLFYYKI